MEEERHIPNFRHHVDPIITLRNQLAHHSGERLRLEQSGRKLTRFLRIRLSGEAVRAPDEGDVFYRLLHDAR